MKLDKLSSTVPEKYIYTGPRVLIFSFKKRQNIYLQMM